MALGFALVYNTTRIFHVAHGAVYTLAGYAAFLSAGALAMAWVPAILAAVLAGLAVELLVYKPIRRRGGTLETYFIASLGTYFILQNALQLFFGSQNRVLRPGPLPTFTVGAVTVTVYHVMVIAIAVLSFAFVQLFLTRTRTGKTIRAIADNPGLCRALGINIDYVELVVLAVASGLAGLSAFLLAFDLGVLPEIGLQVLLIAAVAVIFGGVGYLPGAIVGGFALGLLQSLVVLPLSASWQSIITYTVLIVVLVFRPQGLFGGRLQTRRA